ncbi:MAG: 5'/3'-nucleotidase SurE [Anaerotignaceae bacterium]
MKPLILVTNDDGIHSPGLYAAVEAVMDLGEVLVVAPHKQQTGMGRAFPRAEDLGIIEEHNLLINGKNIKVYGVHGSPAYCVAFAILELAPRKPNLCVSGINYGENLGLCLTCSGTVGAVLEAQSYGVAGVALSISIDLNQQRKEEFVNVDWEVSKKTATKWTKLMLEKNCDDYMILNINIPKNCIDENFFAITRQSKQNYFVFKPPEKRNRLERYELKNMLKVDLETLERNSDIFAVYKESKISVTPLSWDMSMDKKLISNLMEG